MTNIYNIYIRALRHIRPLLDHKVANTVACSIVNTRLDYCNSLLYGLPAKNVAKLQRVQNTLARLVSGRGRWEHVRPVLKDLHWLPITQRVQYKVALITHKVLTTRQPQYLAEIVTAYVPKRELRSSTQNRLAGRSANLKIGERAFSCASRSIWNNLPQELREVKSLELFKRRLKTRLFQEAFCM